jgi:hypothetical protein
MGGVYGGGVLLRVWLENKDRDSSAGVGGVCDESGNGGCI